MIEDNLTNPNLLEDMLLDYMTFGLRYIGYSKGYIWRRWIRT